MDWERIHRLLNAETRHRGFDGSGTFDPLADYTPAQARFISDRSHQRTACTSRRAGKTSAFVRDALSESWLHPDACVVYLNETGDRAFKTFWEEIKRYVERHRLPYIANETKHCLRGPENRWIWVSGGDTKKQINRWKGVLPKAAAFYIDEAQDWQSTLLVHAYTEVIAPALSDIGGRFTVGGVPGPVPDSLDTWYSWVHSNEFSHHGTDENPWSIWDNPYIKDARGQVELVCRTRQVSIEHPTIQREFFGQWVHDSDILVFGALDSQLNAYDDLPEGDWSFAAGADFGFVDSSSISVVGWPRISSSRHIYVTRNEAFDKTGAYETIERVKAALSPLQDRLVIAVADPAAGGKNIMEDVWTRHGIPIEPATKDDKVGAIKLMSSSIATRELLLPRTNVELFSALKHVRWDPNHRGEKLQGHTPDRVDSLLYAFRAGWPWYSRTDPPAQRPYEEERFDRIMDRQRIDEENGGI